MKFSVSREHVPEPARHRRARRIHSQRHPDACRRSHPRGVRLASSSRPPTWSSASACRSRPSAERDGRGRPARPAAARRGPLAAEGRPDARAPQPPSRTSRSSPARRKFHLRTLPLDDFPKLPEPAGASVMHVPAAAFVETIGRVARAASRDETRPHLTGVLVSAAGHELRMVATDSYRLSVKETTLEKPVDGTLEANVPARTLQELSRIAGSGRRRADRDRGAREPGDLQPRRRRPLVAPGRGSLPELSPAAARVLRARAAREPATSCSTWCAASACWRRRTRRSASPSAEGALEVSAQTPDVGEASESLPVPFNGEALEIGFNPEFFRDGLESAESDELILKLISPLRPGLHRVRATRAPASSTSSCRSA